MVFVELNCRVQVFQAQSQTSELDMEKLSECTTTLAELEKGSQTPKDSKRSYAQSW